MERYGLTAVVPIPTALLLWSLNDLQFFFGFYALFLSFRAQSLIFNLRVTIFLLTVGLPHNRKKWKSITHSKVDAGMKACLLGHMQRNSRWQYPIERVNVRPVNIRVFKSKTNKMSNLQTLFGHIRVQRYTVHSQAFLPTQILRYKMAAHWWYSSRVGLHIGKWELIVGSNTQHASLQSVSFSQNVPAINRKFAGFSGQLFRIYSFDMYDCICNWSIERLIDWLIDWLIGWLIDW